LTANSPKIIQWLGATLEAAASVIQSRRRSSNSKEQCRWSGPAYLGDQSTKL